MPVLEGTPWDAGSSPGRFREPSEISCNGVLAQLLLCSRGGFTPIGVLAGSGPLVPARGCVTVPRAPREATLVPPGQCAAGTSLPAKAQMPFPASHPSSRHLASPASLPAPSHPIPASQQKSLVQRLLLQHSLHSARCWHPKPAAHMAIPAAGWGRSHCQKPTPLSGLWVWESPKQGERDMGNGSVPRGAAALPLGAGASLS